MSVDVAAIRAALSRATPRPWEQDRTYWKVGSKYPGMDRFWQEIIGPSATPIARLDDQQERAAADAELIVLLRNNAEALLDELEQERIKNIHWQEIAFAAARDALVHERRGAVKALRDVAGDSASEVIERADAIENGADL